MLKTVVLYRDGDGNSLELAEMYASIHGNIPTLIALPCSDNEVLADYATFQTEIETPLLAALVGDERVFVVSYSVPGGFIDGPDVISTTSRLSRIGHPFSKNYPNPLFNQKNKHRMGDADFDNVKIASRLDAPTFATAKALVSRARSFLRARLASGMFYIDPYPAASDHLSNVYTEELSEFVINTLPTLNLDTFTTITDDPYSDLVVPFVINDSFMWACGADRTSNSFFKPGAAYRVFLYNADTDSAATIREASSGRWPTISVANGYLSTAGSMSVVTPDHYLSPRPFFECLLSQGSIGEAFIFSQPFLDSPETLIGDPLVTVRFPADTPPPVRVNEKQLTESLIHSASQAIGYIYARYKATGEIVDRITTANDPDQAGLLSAVKSLLGTLTLRYAIVLKQVVMNINNMFLPYGSDFPNNLQLNAFLQSEGIEVGQLYADSLAQAGLTVDATNLAEPGSWYYEMVIQNLNPTIRSSYHFELQIANDSLFSDVVFSEDSAIHASGWVYEKELGSFDDIPHEGVPSNYWSRRIRYYSFVFQELSRGDVFYVRMRQKDEYAVYTWQTGRLVIDT